MTKLTKLIKLALVVTGIAAFAPVVQATPLRDPDYAEATGNDWLYNHAIAGKAYAGEAAETDVDMFFVYPTLRGDEKIVIDGFRGIDDTTMRKNEMSLSTAVGAFSETGRCFADMTHVYAPLYRQATLGTAYDCATNAQGEVVANANAQYLAKLCEGPAYGDVTNALSTYFAKWNNGRKLILAAHSQGSALLRLVMENYFTLPENKAKAELIVCSYQIGFGIGQESINAITAETGIKFASDATNTNVIVSYNTMGEGSSGNSTLLPPDTIAINPMTWTRATDLADKGLNLGARTNALGTADVIVPDLYSAQIADTGANRGEVVVCKELNDKVLTNLFGSGSLHAYDYAAYWEDLHKNCYDRGGKLAGFAKLCTTNFPAHLCVSNAYVDLTGGRSLVVDSVAGTVWIPTNGFVEASVTLVPEKGYRLMVSGKEQEDMGLLIDSLSLLGPNGEFLMPDGTFDEISLEYVQRAPDYADATGKDWLFNHDKEEYGKRYEGEPAQDSGVDLFFILPTAAETNAYSTVNGFVDLDDPQLRMGAANEFENTGCVFADFTHVYAPFYRQATLEKVKEVVDTHPGYPNEAYAEALYASIAYADITNALTHYFAKINKNGERPFILAGHSQGSALLRNLMEHYVKDPDHSMCFGNMVACYAIGYGVSDKWAEAVKSYAPIATNATDAGVYVTWNTEGPANSGSSILMPTNTCIGVNPITWELTTNPSVADKMLNLGAWTNRNVKVVHPALYGATNSVARGTVICSEATDYEPAGLFGNASLHELDYKLYWENLRANALQRIKTLNARRLEHDYAQIPLAGTPIDYADPYNWVTNTGTSKPLDVLFVYPTMMLEGDSTIVPVTDAMKAKAYTNAYVKAASAFASYANVVIPAYRQFNMGVCTTAQTLYPESRDFLDYLKGQTPRTDLFAALDYYFTNTNVNATRPFILAGHSQGSAMLKIALEDYFRSNEKRWGYLKKMVATYGLGYSFSQEWFDGYYPKKALTFAADATGTNVLVSWNTEGMNATKRSFVIENGALVINPMNWTTNVNVWSETVPDAMIQQRTATDFDYGDNTYALVTTNVDESAYQPSDKGMGDKSLHSKDWTLWYEQIKANGFTRYAAFAGLKEVSTNNIPTVADTTWKIKMSPDGGKTWAEAVKSPVDGTYYVAADAENVMLVYTIDPAKVAANFVFQGEGAKTSVSFPLAYDKGAGKWVQQQPVEDILASTKVIYNQRKPDYSKAKDWVLNHFLKADEAKSIAGEPADDPGVDLVYVYGTIAMTNAYSTVNGFADIDDLQMRGDEAAHAGGVWGMIPGSVKAFSDYTRVYMPFYRQMTLCGATNVMAHSSDKPMETANSAFAKALQEGVAYEDVAAAFDAYFEKWNEGRPFILAGCSQGAAMLRNMVEEYFTKPENQDKLDKLVACYGIAYGVTKDWAVGIEMNTEGKIHFATNATDAGVYISWNTVGPDSTAIPNGLVPPDAISINPLTWTTEATPAAATLNLGSLTNATTGAIIPHLYDATVDTVHGVVVSTNLPSSDYVKGLVWFGDKSLHGWEISAWWENIRDNAFRRIETATKGKRPRCGTPTDYSKADNWMKKPAAEKALDVFYLYPTCVPGSCTTLVGEIEDGMKAAANEHYKKGPSTFESYANVYAPYYRQGSGLALVSDLSADGIQRFCSTHVVKTDVFAALDYFFTNINVNAKRPFILASHSQGSANMKNVFEEYFVGEKAAYLEKMVAAYVLGYKITPDWCEKVGVSFATGTNDTRVVMTWNAEGPGDSSDNFLTADPSQLAINPLNWTRDTTEALKADNLGSVITNAQGVLYNTGKPGVTGARLQTNRPGAVIVDAPETIPVGISPGFGTKSYHFEDWGFFHDNIGANGYTRYAAFSNLRRVDTNTIPTAVNATWKVLADGQAATVSPINGELYAPQSASEVKVVYTVDATKAAEGYRFVNGETTASFPMLYASKGFVWLVEEKTQPEIKAATKVGKTALKFGVVAQRYPWNGIVDVNYKATYWPASKKGAVEITIGESVTTNTFDIAGSGTVTDTAAIEIPAEFKGEAKFKAIVK